MFAMQRVLTIGISLIAAIVLCGIGDQLFAPLNPRSWVSPGAAVAGVFSFQSAAIALFCAIAWPVTGRLHISDRNHARWAALSTGVVTALAALLLADVLFDVRSGFDTIAQSNVQADKEYFLLFDRHQLEIRAAFVLFCLAQVQWVYATQPDDAKYASTNDKIRWIVDLVGRCLIVSTLVLVWRGCSNAVEVIVTSGAIPRQSEFAYGALSFSASYFPLLIGLVCLAAGCLLAFMGANRES